MSEIAPIGQPNASILGRTGRVNRPDSTNAAPSRISDRVELSPTARLLSKLKDLPDVRQDLVSRVRAEIANGTYDTPDKVDALLNTDSLARDLI